MLFRKDNFGFSLVELMVVISIMGLLSAGVVKTMTMLSKSSMSATDGFGRESFVNRASTLMDKKLVDILSNSMSAPENASFSQCVTNSICSGPAMAPEGESLAIYMPKLNGAAGAPPVRFVGSYSLPTRLSADGSPTKCATAVAASATCPLVAYGKFRREGSSINVWIEVENVFAKEGNGFLKRRTSEKSVGARSVHPLCPAGQLASSVSADGSIVCHPIQCEPGQAFVRLASGGSYAVCTALNKCGADQAAVGLDASGMQLCQGLVKKCGLDEYQAGMDTTGPICVARPNKPACPEGQVVAAIRANGDPVCEDVLDKDNGIVRLDKTGTTDDTRTCPRGYFMRGITKAGVPLCGRYPAVWALEDNIFCSQSVDAPASLRCSGWETGIDCGSTPFGTRCPYEGARCHKYWGDGDGGTLAALPAQSPDNWSEFIMEGDSVDIIRSRNAVPSPVGKFVTGCWQPYGNGDVQCNYADHYRDDVDYVQPKIKLTKMSVIKIYRCTRPMRDN